jgi:4-carboxymuconolactone decarboxylase
MDEERARHLARIAAAAACGRREPLAVWYRAARDAGIPAADLQEATLQVFLFAGYPRTIDAFEELRDALGPDAPPPPAESAVADPAARGRAVFEQVYGPHRDAVLRMLDALHPDFARFTLEHAYGSVLGRPFLPLADREVLAVAMLAALGLGKQLGAHVRGARRAGVSDAVLLATVAAAEEAAGPLPDARAMVTRSTAPGRPDR